MPIYEYLCKQCNHEFEVFYTSQEKAKSEEPNEVCPKCESPNKEKTPPKKTSFQLKGKWYKQGY